MITFRFIQKIKPQKILWFVFLFGISTSCFAQLGRSMTVSGSNWQVPSPLIIDAGSDYNDSYESVADQILLSVTVPLLLGNAKVSVQYQPDPLWNNALQLAIRRTGGGSTICALCSFTGGTNYQYLANVDTELFRITGVLALTTFSNIPIQLRLSGVSVRIPSANYKASVIFTVGAP